MPAIQRSSDDEDTNPESDKPEMVPSQLPDVDSDTIAKSQNEDETDQTNLQNDPTVISRSDEIVTHLPEEDNKEVASTETVLQPAASADEPPAKKFKEGTIAANEEAEKPKKRSPELSKLWKVVEDDPNDFTGWTQLLRNVDSHGELADAREVFDAFLFRYPYCYGYWKKYADLEKRKNGENVVQVFERGVAAIPLSCDLWIHYMNFARAEFSSDEDRVRALYERAVAACGREWRSDKLWDHYVKWEVSLQADRAKKDFRRVLQLYDKILANPTQGLSQQFEMFRDFVKDHDPKELMDDQTFLELRKEILSSLAGNGSVQNENKTEETPDEDMPEDGKNISMEPSIRLDEEQLAMREKIIQGRRKVFKATESKVAEITKFEENIKRPYFHIKPLEKTQLKNWTDYLDFQIKKSDAEIIETLFERCLIACARYEEFWMKYVTWQLDRLKKLENESDAKVIVDKVRDIFTRACTHHLTEKIEIHLAWSAFEESHDNINVALKILQKIEAVHPRLFLLKARRINAERRRGNLDAVHGLYKEIITATAKPSDRSVWSIKYSRFLRLVVGDESAAIRVIEDALLVDEKKCKFVSSTSRHSSSPAAAQH